MLKKIAHLSNKRQIKKMKEGAYCTMIDHSALNSNLKRGILSKISCSLNDCNKYYGYFIGHNEKCYCQYSFIHFFQIFPTFTFKMSKQRKCAVPTFTQKKDGILLLSFVSRPYPSLYDLSAYLFVIVYLIV